MPPKAALFVCLIALGTPVRIRNFTPVNFLLARNDSLLFRCCCCFLLHVFIHLLV